MGNEIALVTAVAGNYDHVGHHVYNDKVDYFFYKDHLAQLPIDAFWNIRELPDSSLDPRRKSKIPKIHPHYFAELRKYNYLIWIDGSMQIISESFVDEILSYLNNGIVLSPHFDGRNCGYGEATIRPPKYANEPLDEQVAYYYYSGFPEGYGLYEAGVQARDMTISKIADLGELWLAQNLIWSYQDQVSLGYSLWKTGVVPDVLPKSFRDFGWVHLNAHKSEL
jgi:hypothetical protein